MEKPLQTDKFIFLKSLMVNSFMIKSLQKKRF